MVDVAVCGWFEGRTSEGTVLGVRKEAADVAACGARFVRFDVRGAGGKETRGARRGLRGVACGGPSHVLRPFQDHNRPHLFFRTHRKLDASAPRFSIGGSRYSWGVKLSGPGECC